MKIIILRAPKHQLSLPLLTYLAIRKMMAPESNLVLYPTPPLPSSSIIALLLPNPNCPLHTSTPIFFFPPAMDTTPISITGPPPPPFPGPHRTIDFSPLEFILGLVAVITIPALIYTFFFAIKCPPNPFRGRRRSSDSLPTGNTVRESITKGVASDVKYRKDEPVKGVDSECPVCLSAFSDGEEVRQLSGCKHSFHGSCIDKWLNSHSNCPVCRALVPVKRPSSSSSAARDADSHQGLPDASSLV